MSRDSPVEVIVRGYRAFIDGDFGALAKMLDEELEWYPSDAGLYDAFADYAEMLRVLAERYREEYRVELERCVGLGDQVVVSFRASREDRDRNDPRPLQARRMFTVERYAAVVTIRDGRVAHVQEYPHLAAAFEGAGFDEDGPL